MAFISLDGIWQLTSPQHPDIKTSISIPGDNHYALFQAGLIPDPYVATNEKEVQWVSQSDWMIQSSFEIDERDLDCKSLELTLCRVDTLAEIWINEHHVLSCCNMFCQYKVDIKPYLKLGSNQIEVRFSRADLEAQRRADKQPFFIPWAVGNNQVPYMNLLRKTQCHSGWDWGINLVVCGIYDSIKIERIQDARLGQVSTTQVWDESGSVALEVEVEFECAEQTDLLVSFVGVEQRLSLVGSDRAKVNFEVKEPKLWWPAGYGEQPLYTLDVSLGDKHLQRKIGLRKLELNTSADEIGSAMEFRINGFPISAKGANWIPMDAMPSLESEQRYRGLLQSAVDANMNMLRVWGGGQYESDVFYELCDEFGLLVWQDMMFACALYPSTPEFIDDVEQELVYQIRRLKEHTCIALWCGDNEVIGALTWYDESKANRDRYVVNYDRLSRVLSSVVEKEDPSRVFWPSSPCNGDLDYGDAWHDDNKGDMHFWDIWHSNASFDAYLNIKPRFCSEFGFQSWPSFSEVKRFVPEQDWNITSPTFESHQKNGRGNSIITEMFTRYFRFPKSFEQMLYLSQVQQAIAIKTGCEYWRAMSQSVEGCCIGN
ncbi:beta-mannosidase [Vibrio sp. JCM 19236]|nr:beta-mannosidase [Vibrio sp. JCM 19236]